MRLLALSNRGLQSLLAEEVRALVVASPDIHHDFVVFDAQDAVKFCYLTRLSTKVLHLLAQGSLNLMVSDILSKVVFSHETFTLKCSREGEHDFTSQEVAEELAASIAEKTGALHTYRSSDATYYLVIRGQEYWFGKDLTGEDLGKRDYRVFLKAESMRGNVAAALLQFAGYDGRTFLDPFCMDGIVAIEAAHIALCRSPHFFMKDKLHISKHIPDALRRMEELDREKEIGFSLQAFDTHFGNINKAKKNAKVAGVHDVIDFRKVDPDWLDIKLEPDSISCIATFLPEVARGLTRKRVQKLYQDFFRRSRHVLEKGAGIACLTSEPLLAKEAAEGYAVEKELEVWQGQKRLNMVLFSSR